MQIPDGANTVIVGTVGTINKPLAIAGGNCALQGFDYSGNDCFWTVTGDNITCIALHDINQDGYNEVRRSTTISLSVACKISIIEEKSLC